jgi:hypothetical protein
MLHATHGHLCAHAHTHTRAHSHITIPTCTNRTAPASRAHMDGTTSHLGHDHLAEALGTQVQGGNHLVCPLLPILEHNEQTAREDAPPAPPLPRAQKSPGFTVVEVTTQPAAGFKKFRGSKAETCARMSPAMRRHAKHDIRSNGQTTNDTNTQAHKRTHEHTHTRTHTHQNLHGTQPTTGQQQHVLAMGHGTLQ